MSREIYSLIFLGDFIAKKKKGPPQVNSGNYFPSLGIGLKNNYIYYTSLLSSNDE